MTKSQLAERILRRFGHPMVKVELDVSQIYDAIDYSRDKFIKWAGGQATHETFFTIPLSAHQYLYDMPVGCVDVLSYDSGGTASGINTLFTVENFMYSRGMLGTLVNSYDGFSLINYHLAVDFLDTLRKYTVDEYNFKYHKYSNQLEIQPPPTSGSSLTYYPKYLNANGYEVAGDAITIDSPGFILIRAYMLEGSTLDPAFEVSDSYNNFYTVDWIEDYAAAFAKKTLGMIRRKFGNFGSLGNQGIALDGDALISEADTEMERLKEDLKLEEQHDGLGILMG